MTDRTSHPVWGVYDALRTPRFNADYYTVSAVPSEGKEPQVGDSPSDCRPLIGSRRTSSME